MTALFLAAALLAAGCGSDDEPQGEPGGATAAEDGGGGSEQRSQQSAAAPAADPVQAVRAAIEAVLTSGNPELACGTYVTRAYLTSAFGGRGGCARAQQPGSAARSVRIGRVSITGTRATATAVPAGGVSGGQEISVRLLREDGVWKVDGLRSDVPVGP
jgi:hypothetical protein